MADNTEKSEWWHQFGPDSPLEWSFDNVPDNELIACCLWEYARESHTIGLKADLDWCRARLIRLREDYERDPALKRKHEREAVAVNRRAKRERFNYESYSGRLWKTDYPLIPIYDAVMRMVGSSAKAWQELDGEIRNWLSKQTGESTTLRPLGLAYVGELEELWKANSAELLEIRATVRPENDDSEDGALWTEANPTVPFTEEDGWLADRLVVALTIDFSRFTDKEISGAFAIWLKTKRPPKWKQPSRVFPGAKRKGHKLSDYRVALERLGLMRLLHYHSPAGLREDMPVAWKKFSAKEQDFRREVREAGRFFRRLFPFLPKKERPFSIDRLGVWFPATQKYMDKLDEALKVDPGSK